jgi:SAM-dependent methyltransferase
MSKPLHYQSLEEVRISQLFAEYAQGRVQPLRVLDYGCGRGKYLALFASLGCEVTGVDTNPAYVADAKARGVAAYSTDDFFRLDTPRFDIILMSHLIEHIAPESLAELIPRICQMLASAGRVVIVTPVPGERFYHDFTHVRPYLPQSIRHAFGQTGAPISHGERRLIELVDIYFFKDPYRTRLWRSFYVGNSATRAVTRALNSGFDALWRLSGGRVGVVASWLGVYRQVSDEPVGLNGQGMT